ncbi:dihydrouridine synthase 4-like protein [Pochonia chlamydosporia 170]|uniref:Dihydrouridine synthase 4-like protein n=1 Tax=Pochonia chlamydosporia 170 TaxID=1380566 RepID=A0A179FD92_METCM|nr:dihydrouridine synthase 4-like protein [Pochonia chlamydosporia 170]OAQ63347.1 dihydrouridine synthase 4-like protein [Pochonia chlamydosporia 170]
MAISGDSLSPGPTPHPLKIFDAARKQDKFVYACAPMVRYSKLAFRQTVHQYGTDLCWTPMILAKEFNRNEFARDSDLTISTSHPQPPTILQFGANIPLELARASSLAAPFVSGVDLNCGCPQAWACAETLGAALMDQRALVRDMVTETRERLRQDGWAVGLESDMENPKGRSVSVKIRVHHDLRKTIDFLDTVIGHPQARNVDWVTIHPRTRHTPSTTPIFTEALEILTEKYSSTLPLLLSGDVFDLSTLPLRHTKADTFTAKDTPRPSTTHLSGFMSARGLLTNPALFAGYAACPWEAVETLMCKVARAPLPFKLALHHVQEMTGPGMGSEKGALLSKRERGELNGCGSMVELVDFLDGKMEERMGRVMRRDL